MERQNNIINYDKSVFTIISSTRYQNVNYVFAINNKDKNDIRFFSCIDIIEEVDDIELIKILVQKMNV